METIFDEEAVVAAQHTMIVLPSDVVASIFQKLDEIKSELQEIKLTVGNTDTRILKIEDAVSSLTNSVPGPSSATSASASAPEPFVSIDDAMTPGNMHHLFIPGPILNKLLVTGKVREAVRLLLLVFYDIKILQKMTLTGQTSAKKSKKDNENEDTENEVESRSPTTQLPAYQIQLIQAAILKLFKVPANRRNVPELVLEWNETKQKEVRTSITSILEYYKRQYSEEGVRVKKSKKGGSAPKGDDFVDGVDP